MEMVFSFVRTYQTIFQCGWTVFIPVPHPEHHLKLPRFKKIVVLMFCFVLNIMMGVERDLVVLTCISLMTSGEHLFMRLLLVWIPSFAKCLFNSVVHWLLWLLVLIVRNLRQPDLFPLQRSPGLLLLLLRVFGSFCFTFS